MTIKIEGINPILPVKDIKASLDYYAKVLGFEPADWVTEDAAFAFVARDGFGIYLARDPGKSFKILRLDRHRGHRADLSGVQGKRRQYPEKPHQLFVGLRNAIGRPRRSRAPHWFGSQGGTSVQ